MDDLNTTSQILDVDEAQRRLADVRGVVDAIMATTREIAALQQELRAMRSDGERDAELRDRHGRAQKAFREKVKELNDLGAVLKDPMTGLIDFYTWVDGELAFLCWQHGEDSIEYWHGIEEGYRGRKPVSDSTS
ncbi:MAG: DUF2203 domain-containing protein [Planctomycetes bacterium]|nr:DUF2203 domain-containing protein [Planctomycetota bacterium]